MPDAPDDPEVWNATDVMTKEDAEKLTVRRPVVLGSLAGKWPIDFTGQMLVFEPFEVSFITPPPAVPSPAG
jgi:hypothetical protein